MTDDLKSIASEIDKKIRLHNWFDFHVLKYDCNTLSIAGGTDLTYYHTLELVFEDVFFVSGFFQGWHTNTSKPAFWLEDDKLMNEKYEINQGCRLFIFEAEDYINRIIVAAKKISFNSDIVYYYDRPDLKDNERIADFVKKKNAL